MGDLFLGDFLLRVFATVVAISGLFTALGVIARSSRLGRPIRWLWRTNVERPVTEWGRGVVRDVVDERIDHLMHFRNNGSSLLDLAESVQRVDDRLVTMEGAQAVVADELYKHRNKVEEPPVD